MRRHLALPQGGGRVTGLTATSPGPLPLCPCCPVSVVVIVADNKAADSLQLVLRATAELTGAIDPGGVLRLPAPDVLPF